MRKHKYFVIAVLFVCQNLLAEEPVTVTDIAPKEPAPAVQTQEQTEPAAAEAAPAPPPVPSAPTYRRELTADSYLVTQRAPHLYMISRDLYGSDKYWAQIARWNNLPKPYDVTVGQRLVIQKPSTLSDAEANKILIRSWTGLNRFDVVEGIVLAYQGSFAQPAATPAKVDTPEPEILAPAVVEHHQEEPHHGSRWHFGVAALALVTELDSDWHSLNSHTKLYTDVDFGFEVEAGYHLTDKLGLHALAALERLEIRPAADGTHVKGGERDLLHFGFGVDYKVTEKLALDATYHHKEEPLVEPTAEGATVDSLYLSQITAGPRYEIFRNRAWASVIGADYLHSMPAKHKGHELEAGQGLEGLLKLQKITHAGAFTLGAKYRQLRQDTHHSKDSLKVYSVSLGFNW